MSGQTSEQSSNRNVPDSPIELLYAEEWAIDAVDSITLGDIQGAKTSHSYATLNLLKLPPGSSYEALEAFLMRIGVKLYHTPESKSPS